MPRDWHSDFPPDQFLVTTLTGRQEVVVIFNQWTGEPDSPRKRWVAWKAGAPEQDLAIGLHAIRKMTNSCETVQILPAFYEADVPAEELAAPPGYAILDGYTSTFSLCLEQAPPGRFALPESREGCRTGWRWGLMPLAVATDAAIIGTITAGLAAGGMSGFSMNSF